MIPVLTRSIFIRNALDFLTRTSLVSGYLKGPGFDTASVFSPSTLGCKDGGQFSIRVVHRNLTGKVGMVRYTCKISVLTSQSCRAHDSEATAE